MTPARSTIARGLSSSHDCGSDRRGKTPFPTNFVALRKGKPPDKDDQPVVVAPVARVEEKTSPTPPPARTARGNWHRRSLTSCPIGREVTTANSGSIDVLAIDANANLVALVLKGEKPPQNILAQTLDQAAGCEVCPSIKSTRSQWIPKERRLARLLRIISARHCRRTVNASHSMIILASELDDSSDRVVRYLAREHNVPIRVMHIALFKTASEEFVGRA